MIGSAGSLNGKSRQNLVVADLFDVSISAPTFEPKCSCEIPDRPAQAGRSARSCLGFDVHVHAERDRIQC
nr:hypothetical protein CFP56_25788 [Quercus suber]